MHMALKEYQKKHVSRLLADYHAARDECVRRGRPQALVLASPTGSGKTVMAAALIENILFGGEEAAAASMDALPQSTILWFSDDPELNEQSRRRIAQVSDRLSVDRLVSVPTSFDQRTFDRGRVYFLNTQKLRQGALLVSPGNRRTNTIWDTIEATEADRPGELLLVVDEAHRGLSQRQAEVNERTTILSRLLDGNGRQRGIGMVLGITATPARFDAYLAIGDRTRRNITILPSEVREEGIIKDRLMLHGIDEDGEHAWTMLGEAIERTLRMDERWSILGHDSSPPFDVAPLLMIQVEDRTADSPSATPLGQLVEELRARWPDLRPDQLVHCFGERQTIDAGGWRIAHMDPVDVSGAVEVRVVLFKTALNTGWDCPRAEVLMSFRSAQDQTAIAQLVGRMVRTPLGHRVEGDDELNSAYLFLPRFDRDALLRIKQHLTADEGGSSFDVDVADEVRDLVLRKSMRPGAERHDVFGALSGIPFDSVEAARSKPDLHRLFALTRMLDLDGIAGGAGGWTVRAADDLIAILAEHVDTAGRSELLGETRQVRIVSLTLEDGRIVGHDERRADLSDADIDRAFKVAAPALSPELASAWLRGRFDEDDPVGAKAAFLDAVGDATVRSTLESRAAELFDETFDANLHGIRSLPEERRAEYLLLRRAARRVQGVFMTPPTSIRVPWPADGTPLDDHIYVEPQDGTFLMTTTEWEVATLREARREEGFKAFLRNYPRKSWSMSYAYEQDGQTKPGYPDFLVIRSDAVGRTVVDILEPHRGEDSLDKARGLASFAERHGERYGRIHMLRFDGGVLRRLRLEDAGARTALRQPLEQADFLALFK